MEKEKDMDIIGEMVEANRLLSSVFERISVLGALAMMQDVMTVIGIDEREGTNKVADDAFALMVTAADTARRYVDMIDACIADREKIDSDFDIEKIMKRFAEENCSELN